MKALRRLSTGTRHSFMPLLFALALSTHGVTHASSTARSFTTEWICDNGRVLRVNAHPRDPTSEARLTYLGNRVEVALKPAASGVRYESQDGKVVWHSKGNEGQLTFNSLLTEPVTCRLNTDRADKARSTK